MPRRGDVLVAAVDQADRRRAVENRGADVATPVAFAVIAPPAGTDPTRWRHFDLQSGSGCHPDPARAAIRAVTEAAQSRVTAISGARDDFDPGDYRARIALDLLAYVEAEAAPRPPAAAAPVEPRRYVEAIVARLKAVGVRSAIVAPLERGERGFAVAKALVPDLETLPGARRFPLGRRALAVKLGRR